MFARMRSSVNPLFLYSLIRRNDPSLTFLIHVWILHLTKYHQNIGYRLLAHSFITLMVPLQAFWNLCDQFLLLLPLANASRVPNS
ncbi:hypothetical protein BT69DRAFT_875220 [Atractiella rhizophila]|nr:hypothetical protein BT69DRAFT_875220 [Atractiella rhizophila]